MPNPTRPPRVLYCTDTYPPQVNGVSVVTALSVTGLQARGWEVEVIAPAYPASTPDPFPPTPGAPGLTSIPSMPLPLYPDLRLSAPRTRTITDTLDRFEPDLVHAATEFTIGKLGQREALRRGLPVVSSYHTDFSRYAAAYGAPWLSASVSRYLSRFHRRSHRVYTPGAPARHDLQRLGVTEVELWGRGVDLEVFHPGRREPMLRRAYADDATLLFLHVGRLASEKGVERLIEGFTRARLLLGASQPIHLVVAGAGPRESTLRAMADQHITFLGNLDRATTLPRLYASADAFLFASETETLGLVILEAMASGLPVVATPAGGVADHLWDRVNGLAYPPGDVEAMARGIQELATTPTLRRQLALGARRTAEALGWDRELDRLDASYREVLEGRALRAAG